LTVVDRPIIELRRRDGWSIRMIARELGRSSGTLCDEIRRHGDAAGYRAVTAEVNAAASRHRSGRKPRLARDWPLFAEIARLLRLGWSPEQISGRRKRIENRIAVLFAPGQAHAGLQAEGFRTARKTRGHDQYQGAA
jgi:IS30 family transposase